MLTLVAAGISAGGGIAAAGSNKPDPGLYVNIKQVPDNFDDSAVYKGPSGGTFSVYCGTNQIGHFNQDNHITSPGAKSAAHHVHDYVGNVSTNAFSTDKSLAGSNTTCRNGDRSAYFWPVLRWLDGSAGDGSNSGKILQPSSVLLKFRGNAKTKVAAMPRFLRAITGNAKAATGGGANANANWTCTDTRKKRTSKYPLCTTGGTVMRVLDFPSCWDGKNLDSADHRKHLVFPGRDGQCPQGTRAVPQLHMVLTYQIPVRPEFAVDSFPEEKRNPVTDHGDFHNLMTDDMMKQVVSCLNAGPGSQCAL